MHPGTQQDQRLAAALRPGYIVPEEFTLAERIRLTLAYAGELRFAGGDGTDAGRWDEALLRDESVLLAEIASFPLEATQASFADAWPWAGEQHLWWRARQLLRRFNGWCQWLERHETPQATQVLHAMLASVGTGVREMLHEAIRCFGLDDGEAKALHASWRVDAQVMGTPARLENADQRLQLLRRLWGALSMAIAKLRPLAQAQLPSSLSSGQHEPAMGLLLAALQLYQDTRAVLNRFPERFTDFYYLDLLRMQPRTPAVEQVHLCLERDPRYTAPVQVPRGTRFLGGKDAHGKAIEFAADQSLEVTDNEVAALYSLRLERDPLISPEREFGCATRMLSQAIPLQAPEAAYVESPAWWPLFGGQAKGSAAKAQSAVLGFALASPMFALKEGDRRIRVSLRMSHAANDDDKLASLLRCKVAQRSAAWLREVFQRFERYEARHHPPRQEHAQDVPVEQLADDAWARAERLEGDVHLCYLLSRCLAAADSDVFCERLGRLFAAWLTAAAEALHPADVDALRRHASGLPGIDQHAVEIDDPLILVRHHEHDDGAPGHDLPDRGLIFARVFRGVWLAELSAVGGWLALDDALVRRREDGAGPGGCIEIVMRLGLEQPPIVPCKAAWHGEGWPAQPLLRLTLQNRTRMYAYSLLQQLILHDIVLDVDVRGMRDIVLYNQLGRLDAGKPFVPFGPMPAVGAYCVLGNAELAAKPLRSLCVNLRWGQLPTGEGGFAERYHGYPGTWTNAGFQVQPQVLRDGQWRGGEAGNLSLFEGERRVADSATLALPEADLAVYHRPQSRVPVPFVYDMNTRNGLFRLELRAPAAAFGHALYPRLMTEALTRNARLKHTKLQLPLPQEPYTPTIEQISIDYTASQLITLKQNGAPSLSGQLFHLHPFGMDLPRARAGTDGVALLPRYLQDGNLYIGLSGSDPEGALSLYFHLRPESAAECLQRARPQASWAVWCEEGWRTLEAGRLLSDSTLGFLRSGIVVLDLPPGMSSDCSRLPGRMYWLRLCAEGALECLAGLYGIHTQAVCASRAQPRATGDACMPLPPGTVRAPLRAIGGLRAVQQIGPSFGLREPDAGDALRVRSAERLRHKQRASTPWDYERLLLDAFAQTFKVKCFANGEAPGAAVSGQAGGVLVVVVPAPRQGVLFHSTEAPRFDAAVLEQMADYLRERSTPGIQVVVRNAVYERVQVRCALQLAQGSHPGAALMRINQAIVEFLSPWHTEGYRANFDWDVRAEAIEARLRELDEVDVVGPISLLHIVRSDDNTYRLRDTARTRGGVPMRRVRPAQPWSLVLPTSRHLIELIGMPTQRSAPPTGVGKLEIGGTFILGSAPGTGQGTP